MRESRLYGSVRGVLGNWHSYRDSLKPQGGSRWVAEEPGEQMLLLAV